MMKYKRKIGGQHEKEHKTCRRVHYGSGTYDFAHMFSSAVGACLYSGGASYISRSVLFFFIEGACISYESCGIQTSRTLQKDSFFVRKKQRG